jgi:hypothetical protein
VRGVLPLVMAVIGVAGLFYLLGSRTLLRHHRLALLDLDHFKLIK